MLSWIYFLFYNNKKRVKNYLFNVFLIIISQSLSNKILWMNKSFYLLLFLIHTFNFTIVKETKMAYSIIFVSFINITSVVVKQYCT